ncbi:MAG: UPF0158 family protein [Simkaniaceae bacterium]|nr:MAG: UPF0158 family protein [Simkaniaceae bacterium]
MTKQKQQEAQNPLILRFHRLMDAFAKSDDERDFYLDTLEGFLVFADLDRSFEELDRLEKELQDNQERYRLLPKMTYYETKKFMEGFVNEKVYDIDTKEKLLDIIGSKESRENFLEFIYDHLTELEKWQQYYHERSRIRIIEWLRQEEIHFAFEEDLDISKPTLEKVKQNLFEVKVSKEIQSARDAITTKSKTYYSNEALNPRPKRGRPPKQAQKVELEPQYTVDLYMTVPAALRTFQFNPDFTSTSVTFSAKFDTEAQLIASLRGSSRVKIDTKLEALSQRLESLRHLSDRLKTSSGSRFGLESEEKMIQAVSQQGSEPEKGKISSIAKGFLPKKKGKQPTDKGEIQEMMLKKRQAGIKQVTPIKRGKKEKDDE